MSRFLRTVPTNCTDDARLPGVLQWIQPTISFEEQAIRKHSDRKMLDLPQSASKRKNPEPSIMENSGSRVRERGVGRRTGQLKKLNQTAGSAELKGLTTGASGA